MVVLFWWPDSGRGTSAARTFRTPTRDGGPAHFCFRLIQSLRPVWRQQDDESEQAGGELTRMQESVRPGDGTSHEGGGMNRCCLAAKAAPAFWRRAKLSRSWSGLE